MMGSSPMKIHDKLCLVKSEEIFGGTVFVGDILRLLCPSSDRVYNSQKRVPARLRPIEVTVVIILTEQMRQAEDLSSELLHRLRHRAST